MPTPAMLRAVTICFIHSKDGKPVDQVQAAAPWEGTHYLLKNCADIESLVNADHLLPLEDRPKFTVVRGTEMAWLCTNPAIPHMAAFVVREQTLKGDTLGIFSTDSPADMRHYVKTGEARGLPVVALN